MSLRLLTAFVIIAVEIIGYHRKGVSSILSKTVSNLHLDSEKRTLSDLNSLTRIINCTNNCSKEMFSFLFEGKIPAFTRILNRSE